MIYIFCSCPLSVKEPDSDYLREWQAVAEEKQSAYLISFEELIMLGNPERAIKFLPNFADLTPAIYRGWMLTPEQYEYFYSLLMRKNIALINSPTEYKHCHYLPESFRHIKSDSADSLWLKLDGKVDYSKVMSLLSSFGESPLIIKDYVKSAKHSWKDACYIADCSDESEVRRVTENFIAHRGGDLNEGVVYRKYLKLKELARHSKSGTPLFLEYRIFYCNGVQVGLYPYWEEGSYPEQKLPLERFDAIAASVESNFFSMDVAMLEDGSWKVIELGDGQVAGLPDRADEHQFFCRLSELSPQ